MKAGWILLIVCFFTIVAYQGAAAVDNAVYLPIVTHHEAVSTYRLDHIRLWDLYENHGAQTTPIDCGHGGRVQVHVFDQRGDVGASARVDGVTVQVTQYVDGQRTERYYVTAANDAGAGVAEFTIQAWADVRLVADADGELILTQSVSISPDLHDVSPAQLHSALYCSDEATCTALITAGACHGQMSWSLVFVRAS